MSNGEKGAQVDRSDNVFAFLWQRKVWWLLPLVVLVLLLLIIYLLVHLSGADSEMYPTTKAIIFLKFLSC